MNIDFKNNKLRKQLTHAGETQKAFGVNAKRVAQRMAEMTAAPNLQILCNIPSANCHPLTGAKPGTWAVDISANHRILFVITNDPLPMKPGAGIDRILVTQIQIIAAGADYH